MEKILLKDIWHLDDSQLLRGKLSLSMTSGEGGVKFIDEWKAYGKNDLGFAFHSHFGGKRSFKEGELCFAFIRIEGRRYLFVQAVEILSVPKNEGTCRVSVKRCFEQFKGRLIVNVPKESGDYGRYVYKLAKFWNQIEVVELLDSQFEPLVFTNLDDVQLNFKQLVRICSSSSHIAYKKNLESVKGVYCITDCRTGQLYIGSAYGKRGVAQRWENYVKTSTGGNERLVDLYEKRGKSYFEKNMRFTLIQHFDKNESKKIIMERERYWKKAFESKKHGNNAN